MDLTITNKQASDAARQIPFSADADLPTDVLIGLCRIVNKQVSRSTRPRALSGWMKSASCGKAPGHDAAVKAGKARVADLAAGDATVEANYQADKAAYYRGRGR